MVLAVAVGWGILGAEKSMAAEYYVSPSGSANWSECLNIDTPCSAQTSMANAVAGDTVYFRNGTYLAPITASSGYTPAFHPEHSGADGNPIIFKAYLGEVPYIDNGNNSGSVHTVGSFGAYYNDYIIWDGFHTRSIPDVNNQAKAVMIYHSNYVTIQNCVIEGYSTGISNNNCIRLDYADYATIKNNKLYSNKGVNSPDVNCAAIMSYYAHYISVSNNDIYDSDTAIYDKVDGENNSYYLNHIWNCGYGFHINLTANDCHTVSVYQNIFRDITETWAIEIVEGGAQEGTANNFKFFNNVIYNSLGISEDAPGVTETEIYNNIISSDISAHDGLRIYTGASKIVDYNDYFNVSRWNIDGYDGSYYTDFSVWQSSVNVDLHSLNSNPFFVNAGGIEPADYKLSTTSLCIGAGKDDVNMGAYITGDEIIGYLENEALTVQCDDSIDNDSDGQIDYPNDSGCVDSSDNNETDSILINTYTLTNFISAITNWLGIGNETSDVNSDGIVNTRDLGVMMSNWGE